ncbi:replication initiator protein A [Ideonella paludis]|uniref:Replication initiator protein A n=1 Tax=Ideonella paludis TaxID=1233411 RepID=A0ABS5E2M5_9BURK|nr:replication initiator protein A [Ideonella paludis]MBQ0937559.1 replication initiator protein A [Ideonella paludis]
MAAAVLRWVEASDACFTANITECRPKSDLFSLEFPVFSLSTLSSAERHYRSERVNFTVRAGPLGPATVHDADVWRYCMGQLVEAKNRGRTDMERTLRFRAHDFLKSTKRPTGGRGYDLLLKALSRLEQTQLHLCIKGQAPVTFPLIQSWVIHRDPSHPTYTWVQLTLPAWVWGNVRDTAVLAIDAAYFDLRQPIERRLYDLARKHCGRQPSWRINLSLLQAKVGSQQPRRNFMRALRTAVEANRLPTYRLYLDPAERMLHVYQRSGKGHTQHLAAVMGRRPQAEKK